MLTSFYFITKPLWLRLRGAPIYGYKDTNLEGSLMMSLFSSKFTPRAYELPNVGPDLQPEFPPVDQALLTPVRKQLVPYTNQSAICCFAVAAPWLLLQLRFTGGWDWWLLPQVVSIAPSSTVSAGLQGGSASVSTAWFLHVLWPSCVIAGRVPIVGFWWEPREWRQLYCLGTASVKQFDMNKTSVNM